MKPSQACVELIKQFEGCCLQAYPDPGSPLAKLLLSRGLNSPQAQAEEAKHLNPSDRQLSGAPWTIGYGTTGPWVKPGAAIPEQEADRLLLERVQVIGRLVCQVIPPGPTQGQLDALTSLCYNIGQAAFKGSNLLKLINKHNNSLAAEEFLKWVHSHGVVLPGLVRRREAEKTLFLST